MASWLNLTPILDESKMLNSNELYNERFFLSEKNRISCMPRVSGRNSKDNWPSRLLSSMSQLDEFPFGSIKKDFNDY